MRWILLAILYAWYPLSGLLFENKNRSMKWLGAGVVLLFVAAWIYLGRFEPSLPEPKKEERLPQTVWGEPGEISLDRNFYLVVDASGSMNAASCAGSFPTRVDAAKWAVTEFVKTSVPEQVNLGLYVFDAAGGRERAPIAKGNRQRISTEINGIRGGGNTPLNEAIRTGVVALSKQRERQLGYGEFYVVVASDGEATDGDLAAGGVGSAMRESIPIITIGFCLDRNHPLSTSSISYRNANSPGELLTAFQATQGESAYFDQAAFRRR